jgi:molybdate transport system ATP-binding protein
VNTQIASPHLGVRIQYRHAALHLDVTFELTQPWTVLFGPSGSGKTTVLRSIAGFVQPQDGFIVGREGEVFFDRDKAIVVPPHKRAIRTAGQAARLFPHMTVRQNVAIGTRWYSKPEDEKELVERILRVFDLSSMADRMPRELSGGEGQKAALARAAASAVTCDRAILLLDEPFTGLDVKVRDQLIVRLREWLIPWKIPVLSVTHDVAEAFQLGDEVIKIAEGKVVAQGPAEVVLAEERKRLLAQLGSSSA